jgi:hypothetical protein
LQWWSVINPQKTDKEKTKEKEKGREGERKAEEREGKGGGRRETEIIIRKPIINLNVN